jgi:hypothetical protein
MTTAPRFLSHLSDSLTTLLSQVLDDAPSGMLGLFRRPSSLAHGGYALELLRHEIVDEHKGTIVETRDEDRVVVYRTPARFRATFRLSHPTLTGTARLAVLDKLTAWFFDHRSLEPYFPESVGASPALREALGAQRAELRLLPPPEPAVVGGFHFFFEYVALFHSGTALREETRVRSRAVVFPENAERSLR